MVLKEITRSEWKTGPCRACMKPPDSTVGLHAVPEGTGAEQ